MIDLPSAKDMVCVLETTQALSFAQRHYKEYVRFTANEDRFPEVVSGWLKEHEKLSAKTLLILDDLQWVFDEERRQEIFSLLIRSRSRSRLHIMLISRAALPGYLSPLWMTQQLVVEDQEALRFDKPQIRELLLSNQVLSALPAEQQYRYIDVALQDLTEAGRIAQT